MNPPQTLTRPPCLLAALTLFATVVLPAAGAPKEFVDDHDHDHDHSERKAEAATDPSERIHAVEVAYEIRRDGTVEFEQRFRLGVAGAAIRRGPVLNYLTVFKGPGGLILDNELEILEVTRDGSPEPFRAEPHDGFTTLFIGSADRDLEHRIHDYRIRGRTQSDWRREDGVFSAVFDLVGPLPRFPIGTLNTTIRLPEGVELSQYTASVTGAEDPASGRRGPAFESGFANGVLTVRSTASLGADRSFFVNLAWPSATFATKSQWLKVLRQHPKIPLTVFSCLLLAWALLILLQRIAHRAAARP